MKYAVFKVMVPQLGSQMGQLMVSSSAFIQTTKVTDETLTFVQVLLFLYRYHFRRYISKRWSWKHVDAIKR